MEGAPQHERPVDLHVLKGDHLKEIRVVVRDGCPAIDPVLKGCDHLLQRDPDALARHAAIRVQLVPSERSLAQAVHRVVRKARQDHDFVAGRLRMMHHKLNIVRGWHHVLLVDVIR